MTDTLAALRAEKRRLLEQRMTLFEGGELPEGCCPQCGWHVSSHGMSGYGLDCPGGASPTALAGKLPRRRDVRFSVRDTVSGTIYPQPNKLIAEKVAEMHGQSEVIVGWPEAEPRPYTEADVDRVAEAIHQADDDREWYRKRARAALTAAGTAGRES